MDPRPHLSAGTSTHLAQADLGAQTRERLLAAAESLFAQRGYAGTSVRDIVGAADCNLAAVNYHFGGKRNLYTEMFRRRLADLRERRIASIRDALSAASGPGALEEVLRAFATAFLAPLVAAPDGWLLVDLWAREMLDRQLPPAVFDAELIRPVHVELAAAIAATAPGVDAETSRMCVISVIGQLVQVAHAYRRSVAAGTGAFTLPAIAGVIDHLVTFSAGGIRARGAVKERRRA